MQFWSVLHVAVAVAGTTSRCSLQLSGLPFPQDQVTLGTSFKDESGVFLSLSLHLPCRESDSIKYSQWMGHFLKGWSILSFRLHLEPPSITLVLMGAKDNPRVFNRKFAGIECNCPYPLTFTFKGFKRDSSVVCSICPDVCFRGLEISHYCLLLCFQRHVVI